MENNIETLTFNRLPMVIGNLPSSYVDSMSYYETLVWLCNYLQETVIPTVNNNGQAVEELQTKYIELKNYVDHYFDNLDVQEEINKKLDEMTENGSLTNIIKNYVNPIYQAFETEINGEIANQNIEITNFKNTVNGQITSINTAVQSIASGSPKGVYATVSDLETDDPSHSDIYLVTADGKWYYYNTTSSAWVAGGTYQSTGVSNGSITGSKTNFLNNSVNKLQLADDSGSSSGVDYTVSNGVVTLDGTATSNTYVTLDCINEENLTGIFRASNFTGEVAGLQYGFDFTSEQTYDVKEVKYDRCYYLNNQRIYRYKIRIANGTVLSNLQVKPMFSNWDKYYDTPTIGFKAFDNFNDNSNVISDLGKIIKPENTTFIKKGINLVNPKELKVGNINGCTYGILAINDSLSSYRTISITNNTNETKSYYVYPRYRQRGIYNGVADTYSLSNDATTEPSIIEIGAYSRLDVAFYNSDSPNLMIAESDEAVNYVPFMYYMDNLYTEGSLIPYITNSNVLYNKKYVALGDSFTHGDFTNAPIDNYHITSGRYTGELKVYPFIIGNRNEMLVNNLAVNGMTLTNIDGSSNNYLSDSVLSNIPSDVDYITIKIGINDDSAHQNAPIGTIDSTDSTTFYGSFNRVMNYLITSFPEAKIGILVSNGISDINIVNATINIAKKYGIAYLNEATGEDVPLLMRSLRSDVATSIKNYRNNNWAVSTTSGSTNYHPNANAHEYESTIVENFLKSL